MRSLITRPMRLLACLGLFPFGISAKTVGAAQAEPDAHRQEPVHHQAQEAEAHNPAHAHDHSRANGSPSPLIEPAGSGTSWLPGSSPIHANGFHGRAGGWNLMFHGETWIRATGQNLNHSGKWRPKGDASLRQSLYPDLERGGAAIDAPNWAMLSADRSLIGSERGGKHDGDDYGKGNGNEAGDRDRLQFRAMLSFDPWTEGRDGHPLLLQTGEGLVDRQHAHDLFMELSVQYRIRTWEGQHAFVYFGLPGEPALGPAAFMHRISSHDNPDVPLGHHSQDAAHITEGVATVGYIVGRLKLDGSLFRGREPDADRLDIEAPSFDSYSLRLTANSGRALSLQASAGMLRNSHEPGSRTLRGSASASHNLETADGGNWATTVLYGFNRHLKGSHEGTSHSAALETARGFRRLKVWGRWESLQRMGGELDVPVSHHESIWVHAMTAGGGAGLGHAWGMEVFLGAQGTVHFLDGVLDPYYGSVPLSAQAFLRLRPASRGAAGNGAGVTL